MRAAAQCVNSGSDIECSQSTNIVLGIGFQDTATPYQSQITVSGVTGTPTSLTVRFDSLQPPEWEDLDVLLVDPNVNGFG